MYSSIVLCLCKRVQSDCILLCLVMTILDIQMFVVMMSHW